MSPTEKRELADFILNYDKYSSTYINNRNLNFFKSVWLRTSGALAQRNAHPGYYDSLKNSKFLYPNPDFDQIELDVTRTFPHLNNKAKREKKEQQLRNVLTAYLKRNAKVGYF